VSCSAVDRRSIKEKNQNSQNTELNKNEHVRFEVFTAVTMTNGVFWDFTPSLGISSQRVSVASYR
jgi:hypothetical protein